MRLFNATWWGVARLLATCSLGACTDDLGTQPVPADGASMDGPDGSDQGQGAGRCDPRARLEDGGTAFNLLDGCPLPNLVPVIERVQIQTRTFSAASCEVVEGCTMPGRRRLLRFDLKTPNIGQGDQIGRAHV